MLELIDTKYTYSYDDKYVILVTQNDVTGTTWAEVYDEDGETIDNIPDELKKLIKQEFPTISF